MAGNNPRKFKDRIALHSQKQAEGTAQFQEVMREVAEVRKPPVSLPFDGDRMMGGGEGGGVAIPRHLAPLPTHQHYRLEERVQNRGRL